MFFPVVLKDVRYLVPVKKKKKNRASVYSLMFLLYEKKMKAKYGAFLPVYVRMCPSVYVCLSS